MIDYKTKKKKKKPMSEEQRKAAAERLAKAREAKGPAKLANIPDNIKVLDDEHPLSLKNTRHNIRVNKQRLANIKNHKNSKVASERALYINLETYIKNLEAYLRTGTYYDFFYGENQESQIISKCVWPSYDENGEIKRCYGVFYEDIAKIWKG